MTPQEPKSAIERLEALLAGLHRPDTHPGPELRVIIEALKGEWKRPGATVLNQFYLDRIEDATGVSGVGRVAEGFIFDDGTVALRWLTEHRSTAVYSSIEEVEAIHLHHGATKISRAPRFSPEEREALNLAAGACAMTQGRFPMTSYGEAGLAVLKMLEDSKARPSSPSPSPEESGQQS